MILLSRYDGQDGMSRDSIAAGFSLRRFWTGGVGVASRQGY